MRFILQDIRRGILTTVDTALVFESVLSSEYILTVFITRIKV